MPSPPDTPSPLRICFVLPGLHRVNRGAETAFESVAAELAQLDGCDVTLFGSGQPDPTRPYRFVHVPCRPRECFERWPRFPGVRTESVWEELSFIPGLARVYDPTAFDVSVTCSYPYTNWFLRSRRRKGSRPAHVYVTQNGDWPCHAGNSEYRWFGCDGLICTNPEYYERNKNRWNSVLIPNGVDPQRFHPGAGNRQQFNLPHGGSIVLMVSALIPSKRVLEGIEAVSLVNESPYLVIAGDGPLREQVLARAAKMLPGRFQLLSLPRHQMPDLYRCADVMLHMSLDEPSANAYIEALSTGIPIVTHRREVTRWTLQECGFLTDCQDLQEVAGSIQAALAAVQPDLTIRQRELVQERYTWKAIALAYRNLFRTFRNQD